MGDPPLAPGGSTGEERPPRAVGSLFGPYARLVRARGYLRVFTAGLGSVAGSAIALVTMIWIVASSTGSELDVAALGAAWTVSSVAFSLFGGALVDRYDGRRLMVLSDLARAAAMAVAAVDLQLFGFHLVVLVGVYAVVGAFGTIFNPAENAIVPRLVPGELVSEANGLVRSSRSALQFAGSAVGGALIVSVGPTWGLAANVLTFLLSASLLAGVRAAPATSAPLRPDPGPRPGYFAELAEGFRWLGRARGFLQLTVSATVFNFCSSLLGTFLVFYATELLHGSAVTFALLLALEVAGSGLGALLVGPLRAVRWAGKAWTIPYGLVSGGVALSLAFAPSVPVAFVDLFVLGVCAGFAGTAWLSAAQTLVPPGMQGRYFGIDNLGSVAIIPAAQVGGALLIGAFGLQPTYQAIALLWVVAGALFLWPRELRRLGSAEGSASRRSGAVGAGRSGSPAESRDA